MLKIAITGSIGSGKSYVCGLLRQRGINIYDCDTAAKRIITNNIDVRFQLTKLVGKDVYIGKNLNKAILADYILASKSNAEQVNRIVHPVVATDFLSSGCQWMECAILYTSGFNKLVDKAICVTAPLDLRINRIVQRDHVSSARAKEWIYCQMSQSDILKNSDFEIINDGKHEIENQIDYILNQINIIGNNKFNS